MGGEAGADQFGFLNPATFDDTNVSHRVCDDTLLTKDIPKAALRTSLPPSSIAHAPSIAIEYHGGAHKPHIPLSPNT